MPYEFKLPDLGEGVVEGEITRWLVSEGQSVEEDQPMVEVMTDKATVEIPSPVTGTVTKRFGQEGEIIKVGSTMLVIQGKEEKEELPDAHVEAQVPEPVPAAPTSETIGPTPSPGPVLATPAVRRLAREMGVNLSQVKGSGPGGRITRKDLERPPSAGAGSGETNGETTARTETVPYRGRRKKIGDHLSVSKRTAVHFTYVEEVDATKLVSLRRRLQESARAQRVPLKYLPFFMKAAVAGLKEYPVLNSTLDEEQGVVVLKKYYHLGIATDTPEGLIVPVVRNVDRKDLWQLAEEVSELAERARTGKTTLENLKEGTFTVTSLGTMGGIAGTPIINYPEVAVLAIHSITPRPVVRDGEIVIREMVNLSLSMDHRVVDGAVGVRFLHHIIPLLEDPAPHFPELG